jgi:hypothetical protein
MAYTDQSLANDAYERLKVLNPATLPSIIPRIITMIPAALSLLAERALREDSEGLQKDFAATPVAGEVDLTALSGILFDLKKSTVRIASSDVTLNPIDNITTLEQANLSVDQVYYTQRGMELVFRNTDGLITTFTTPVVIKSTFIPTTATLPARYDGALVATLVEMAGGAAEATERVAAA